MKKNISVVLLALALASCAAPQLKPVETHRMTNEQGHVIGHKQVVYDMTSGSQLEEITLYTPRFGAGGEVIGYEEAVAGGAVLRDLDGRRIGVRQVDLRSRATNQANPGITTLFVGH